jgi:hypothetical protein
VWLASKEFLRDSVEYGGTYAHKDIAFEFGSATSPVFKLCLIKVLEPKESREEFARLAINISERHK